MVAYNIPPFSSPHTFNEGGTRRRGQLAPPSSPQKKTHPPERCDLNRFLTLSQHLKEEEHPAMDEKAEKKEKKEEEEDSKKKEEKEVKH